MGDLAEALFQVLEHAEPALLESLKRALEEYAREYPMTIAYQRLASTGLTAVLLDAMIRASGAEID